MSTPRIDRETAYQEIIERAHELSAELPATYAAATPQGECFFPWEYSPYQTFGAPAAGNPFNSGRRRQTD